MKIFNPLILLLVVTAVHARYFERPARFYNDDFIRDLLRAEEYGLYRDVAPVKAASGKTCQTPCAKDSGDSIYTCKTSDNHNDPCSPKGLAVTGQYCYMFPCKLRGGHAYTTCYVDAKKEGSLQSSITEEKCSMY